MSNQLYSVDSLRELKGKLFPLDSLLMTELRKGKWTSSNGSSNGYKLDWSIHGHGEEKNNWRYMGKECVQGNAIKFETSFSDDGSSQIRIYSNGLMQGIHFQDYTVKGTQDNLDFTGNNIHFADDESISLISSGIYRKICNTQYCTRAKVIIGQYAVVEKEDGTLFLAVFKNGIYEPISEVRGQLDLTGLKYGVAKRDLYGIQSCTYGLREYDSPAMFEAYQKREYSKYAFRPLVKEEKQEVSQYVDMLLKLPSQIIPRITRQLERSTSLAKEQGYSIEDVDIDNYIVEPSTEENLKRTKNQIAKLLLPTKQQ